MKTFSYTIKDEVGIHARPAGNLAKLAKGFEGTKVTIEKGGKSVDVTKLMMLMGLGVKCGDTVTFTVEGADEDACADAVLEFMTNNL
ncbi:MAG: HPr family phosphocarrier protein [Clostridia bacterium]|nr:HPr family phosphocarrier protein [Clostridia bacterium]